MSLERGGHARAGLGRSGSSKPGSANRLTVLGRLGPADMGSRNASTNSVRARSTDQRRVQLLHGLRRHNLKGALRANQRLRGLGMRATQPAAWLASRAAQVVALVYGLQLVEPSLLARHQLVLRRLLDDSKYERLASVLVPGTLELLVLMHALTELSLMRHPALGEVHGAADVLLPVDGARDEVDTGLLHPASTSSTSSGAGRASCVEAICAAFSWMIRNSSASDIRFMRSTITLPSTVT